MIKVEDVTNPDDICDNPRHSKRVMQITGTEIEISRLEAIFLAADPSASPRSRDEQVWNDFVHTFSSACCW